MCLSEEDQECGFPHICLFIGLWIFGQKFVKVRMNSNSQSHVLFIPPVIVSEGSRSSWWHVLEVESWLLDDKPFFFWVQASWFNFKTAVIDSGERSRYTLDLRLPAMLFCHLFDQPWSEAFLTHWWYLTAELCGKHTLTILIKLLLSSSLESV